MNVNQYMDIAKKAVGETPAAAPTVDHSAQTALAMDLARRQSEKPAEEQKPIPPLGTMPIAN